MRPFGESGMTLVELLVTLTLLGVLSLAMFGSVRLGARSWDVAYESGEARDEIVLAQGFLRRRLTEMVSQTTGIGDGKDTALSGDARSLSFVAPWLGVIAQGGLYRFEVSLTEGEMVLSWRPLELEDQVPLSASEDLVGQRVLLRGLEKMSFQYFGRRDRDQDPAWHDDWPEIAAVPPDLVRLDVTFGPEKRRAWPSFIVAILSRSP
jgi:general secretion pathway protein J